MIGHRGVPEALNNADLLLLNHTLDLGQREMTDESDQDRAEEVGATRSRFVLSLFEIK